jgi:hypothetical protein
MKKSTLRILFLILLAIGIVGIYIVIREMGKLNTSVSPENRISKETLQLLNDMKNSDVIWSGTYFGLLPIELTGASRLLLDVQEDINPILIDALVDDDKFVAAHVLLSSRTSISIAAPRRGQWRGLKVQSNGVGGTSFHGNDLVQLQEYWREKLQQYPGFQPTRSKLSLQNLVCEFPCWQGITPQKTRFEDVTPILQKAKIHVLSVKDTEIIAQFENTTLGIYSTNGMVDNIILFINHQGIRLGDIVQIIGLPEKITFSFDPFLKYSCSVILIFPENGTILDLSLAKTDQTESNCQVKVDSDSPVSKIVLVGDPIDSRIRDISMIA